MEEKIINIFDAVTGIEETRVLTQEEVDDLAEQHSKFLEQMAQVESVANNG